MTKLFEQVQTNISTIRPGFQKLNKMCKNTNKHANNTQNTTFLTQFQRDNTK